MCDAHKAVHNDLLPDDKREGKLLVPGSDGPMGFIPAPLHAGKYVATVVLRYHGRPHQVPEPSKRPDAVEGLGLRVEQDGEVWTMQEPYGAFTWYPVNDIPSDKARYDIRVTVPAGWTAVASGEYQGTAHGAGGDTFTWHGSYPQASYLTTLAIGHYTRLDEAGPHGLPTLRLDRQRTAAGRGATPGYDRDAQGTAQPGAPRRLGRRLGRAGYWRVRRADPYRFCRD